jgi:transposase
MSRKKYTLEFKSEAVKLVTEQNYTQIEAANSLGIPLCNLRRWVQEAKTRGITKEKKLTAEQLELVNLRKQVKRLEMERDILKKAAAFFANESL